MRLKICLLTICALALTAQGTLAKSDKRGVGENQFSFESQMSPLEPGVTWYYNWANVPGSGYNSEVINYTGFEYVPMCWNASYSADKIREYCAEHSEVKYLLGFNEPNFTSQANMTAAEAAEAWTDVKALADELGLKLVGPAVNYSSDGDDNDPFTWYANFVSLVGTDAFDYIALHCYGGAATAATMIEQMYSTYGKQIWLTEFCYWPNGTGDVYVAPATQISSMLNTVEYLEKSDAVFRYAWFKAVGDHDSSSKPNYGLIVTKAGLGERELSPQGYVYTYMTDFDETVYHATETEIAASEYINQSAIQLYPGYNDDCPSPIEISQFNAGAYADYQFDVPTAGDYYLVLTVAGAGEPTRFDPTIGVYAVNDDDDSDGDELSEPVQFEISGNDSTYTRQYFPLTLSAGEQKIRIKDTNAYKPSGIHISTVMLADAAGITGAEADASGDYKIATSDGQISIIGSNFASALVYDLNGRLAASTATSNTIDASALNSGVYILKILGLDGSSSVKKIVIK